MALQMNTVPLKDRRKSARDGPAINRGIGDYAEASFRDVIHKVEDMEVVSVGNLIIDEIHGPVRVASGLHQNRRTGSDGPARRPLIADSLRNKADRCD